MKSPFKCPAIIIIALIFSICFTGQHLSHGEGKIGVNINVVKALHKGLQQDLSDDPLDRALRDTIEPTEEETLVQSYIERDLSNSEDGS